MGIIVQIIVLIFGLIWASVVMFFRLKKGKSLVYLMFFTLFYVYLVKVLDYTLFQFQSLLLLRYFVPDLMLQGQATGEVMNLVPLIMLTMGDLKTSLLNTLLMIPFGFGLPFISDYRLKKIVLAGVFFSIVIESLQFLTGFLAKITFRIADINDVIFNTFGVVIGYVLFISFLRIFRYMFRSREKLSNPVVRYIAERPQ
jgi:glycopeptide antibiotics resistance protein